MSVNSSDIKQLVESVNELTRVMREHFTPASEEFQERRVEREEIEWQMHVKSNEAIERRLEETFRNEERRKDALNAAQIGHYESMTAARKKPVASEPKPKTEAQRLMDEWAAGEASLIRNAQQ